MERRYSSAGLMAYLNAAAALGSAAAILQEVVSGWVDGNLIPLGGGVSVIATAAGLLLVAGALWTYAGSQISYGVPGWSREGALLFCGGMLSGIAVGLLLSGVAGAVLLLLNLIGAALLATDPDRRIHPFRAGAAVLLLLGALAPGAVVVAADLAAARLTGALGELLPEPQPEVAVLLQESTSGVRRFAAAGGGLRYDGLPDYREMLSAEGRSGAYAVGLLQQDGVCRSEGVQSLPELGGSGLLLLEAGQTDRGSITWREGPEGRDVGGTLSPVGPFTMLPYLPTLRPAAIGGEGPQLSLCSLLDGLARSTVELQSDGDVHLLTLDPGRAELSARVGQVLRSFRVRERAGTPRAVNALLTLTGQATPDLRSITGPTRQVRIRIGEDGRMVHLSTLVESGGELVPYDLLGFEAGEGTVPPPAGTPGRISVLLQGLLPQGLRR